MAKTPTSQPTAPSAAADVQPVAPQGASRSARIGLDTLSDIDLADVLVPYTPGDEDARREALIQFQETNKKVNTLGVQNGADRQKLMDLTRRKYAQMDAARQPTNRLFAAFNEIFSKKEARELKALARYVTGHYLNTHQYHSAPHALGMTREMLQQAELAGYRDPKVLKALIISGLYHDTGNGLHPVPPVGIEADEVQAFRVLAEDIKTAESIARLSEQGIAPSPSSDLRAIQTLRYEVVTVKEGNKDVQYPMLDVIAACIAATVFRDRFAPSDVVAFDQYVVNILEILHGKSIDGISASSLINIKKLINSGPAWITKNADISGSTNTVNVLQANLQNRLEDSRRGMAKDAGPVGYHNGFIGFISASFHQGLDWAPVKQAKQGAPFYMPDGNSEAVENYGRQRLAEEKERFEQLMISHKPMIIALYILIQQGIDEKENVLEWPLLRVRETLEELCSQPGGIRAALESIQKQGIMIKEKADELGDLEITPDGYPLLFDQRLEAKSISDLTPGVVNRIFAPNAARAETSAMRQRRERIAQLGDNPSWEQLEGVVGKLTEDQKALIQQDRVVETHGKNQSHYWNMLRHAGLSITQIQDLAACGKIHMPGYENMARTSRAVEALEDLESGATIDQQPCLARFLEVADLNPNALRIETFGPGDTIIEAGENPERVFVIIDGRALVELPHNMITLFPGGVMGEISALTGQGAVSSVKAMRDVTCITLPAFELSHNYQNEDLRLNAARLAARRMGIELE